VVRILAAKIEFSYGAGQTVNLLALRLQWFESTPTQASPRAILQKPLTGDILRQVEQANRLCQEARNLRKLSPVER